VNIKVHTSAKELGNAEAAHRLKIHGANKIPHVGYRTAINIFLSQLKSFLI